MRSSWSDVIALLTVVGSFPATLLSLLRFWRTVASIRHKSVHPIALSAGRIALSVDRSDQRSKKVSAWCIVRVTELYRAREGIERTKTTFTVRTIATSPRAWLLADAPEGRRANVIVEMPVENRPGRSIDPSFGSVVGPLSISGRNRF